MIIFFDSIVKCLRNLKWISIINIAGLSAGIAAVIMISLWLTDELNYDRWIENYDRVFRVEALMDYTGEPFVWVQTPGAVSQGLKDDFPEVEVSLRLKTGYNENLEMAGDIFPAENLWYAPPEIFDIFQLKTVYGSPAESLNNLSSIVISEKIARKYFGTKNPVGEPVKLNNSEVLLIGGVIEDTPGASHISFDYILPFRIYASDLSTINTWNQFNFNIYIRLAAGVDPEEFNSKLENYMRSMNSNAKGRLFINPVRRIYLWRSPGFESMSYPSNEKGPIARVILFSVIGIIIFVIALINFVNLSTALASDRAGEIGIRKVSGAGRSGLISSLFGESLVQSIIATLAALLLVVIALPLFNSVAGKEIGISSLFVPRNILAYSGIALLSGLITGIYPALLLSSMSPLRAIRSVPGDISHGGGLRKALVVVQLSFSVMFIFSILVMGRQIEFIQEKDLGFDRENIMILKPRTDHERMEVIAEELSRIPGVSRVALGGSVPVNMGNWSLINNWEGNDAAKAIKFHMMQVDDNYFDLFGFQLAEGDKLTAGPYYGEVIINEAAVRMMGIDNPVGKRIGRSYDGEPYLIKGVVRDFHFRKLTDEINPVFIYKATKWWNTNLFVKLEPGTGFETIESVRKAVTSHVPGFHLTSYFLDDKISDTYDDEYRLNRLVRIFTALSLLISAIGLFSLTAFAVRKRSREIGIRKVNGASTPAILALLARENWILTLLAAIPALPLATILLNRWLDTYAYHINITPTYYLAALAIALIVSTATLLYHAVKAANLNPVDTLRDE